MKPKRIGKFNYVQPIQPDFDHNLSTPDYARTNCPAEILPNDSPPIAKNFCNVTEQQANAILSASDIEQQYALINNHLQGK